MTRAAHTDLQRIADLMASATETSGDSVIITDFDRLRQEVVPQLAINCLLGNHDVRNQSLDLAWTLSQSTGMPFMEPTVLFSALIRDRSAAFRTPVVDISELPFEMTRIIFNAANAMEVGPLIFLMSRGAADNSGRVAAVMLAALCENFQAPVLFLDRSVEIPVPFEFVHWKNWLFDEQDDVSRDGQSTVLGRLIDRPVGSITRIEWDQLFATSEDAWEFIRDQLTDVCSALFETLEVNETFPVLKRYMIPASAMENQLRAL